MDTTPEETAMCLHMTANEAGVDGICEVTADTLRTAAEHIEQLVAQLERAGLPLVEVEEVV